MMMADLPWYDYDSEKKEGKEEEIHINSKEDFQKHFGIKKK